MTKIIDSRLDVTGVCCPLPLIQLAKTTRSLKTGQTLEITGNDPIFEPTIRDFCLANGHEVLEVTVGEKHYVSILLQIGG
jgi:TusA-related sulfurtransferase